jgi:glycosyltransferase involved in cell wall biosynthesis
MGLKICILSVNFLPNVGGIPCPINDGKTRLLVKPKDPAGLADAPVCVLTDATARRGMGISARNRAVERFS